MNEEEQQPHDDDDRCSGNRSGSGDWSGGDCCKCPDDDD